MHGVYASRVGCWIWDNCTSEEMHNTCEGFAWAQCHRLFLFVFLPSLVIVLDLQSLSNGFGYWLGSVFLRTLKTNLSHASHLEVVKSQGAKSMPTLSRRVGDVAPTLCEGF